MIDIGTSMQYYGGFNERWRINGGNLIGAGEIAQEWVKTIRKDLKRESKRIRKAEKA
jgi:translation initiation factor 2 alpha subunit (eIF-2alpha)